MDKVQFNTEVVNMRKTVKTVKVLIVHSLTRQVKKLQSKKGSEQQVLKNQRRATKLLAEVEAIKDVPLDTFTKKAVTFKKGLQEVLNNPKSSALDRVMARLIHHRLTQERVVKFEGMVTKDLLRTGTKKYRRLRKENFEAEATARRKDEEDYHDRLERMIKAKKISKEQEEDEEEDNTMSDEDDDEESASDRSDDNRWEGFNSLLSEVSTPEELGATKHKLLKAEHVDNKVSTSIHDGNINDSIDPSNAIRNKQSETSLHPKAGKKDKSALCTEGHKKGNIDSVFPTSLSDMKVDDLDPLQGNNKEDLKQKDKGLLEKQSKYKSDVPLLMLHKSPVADQPSSLQKTLSADEPNIFRQTPMVDKPNPVRQTPMVDKPNPVRQTPMVDKPNPVRQTQGEKLIPGINFFPDQAVRTGAPGKAVHKNTQSRPKIKQSHPSEWGNKASLAKHPTSDTKPPQKIPATKEQLHPSWEASKKRKLESKIVPFQGKKIVFDED